MDTSDLATSFGAQLPAWVSAELPDVPDLLVTDEDKVRVTNRLASRNQRVDTGGP